MKVKQEGERLQGHQTYTRKFLGSKGHRGQGFKLEGRKGSKRKRGLNVTKRGTNGDMVVVSLE